MTQYYCKMDPNTHFKLMSIWVLKMDKNGQQLVKFFTDTYT